MHLLRLAEFCRLFRLDFNQNIFLIHDFSVESRHFLRHEGAVSFLHQSRKNKAKFKTIFPHLNQLRLKRGDTCVHFKFY